MYSEERRVGWMRFRIRSDGDKIYVQIRRTFFGVPLSIFSPAEVNLSEYAAIFTDYEFQRGESSGYDLFTIRIMKLSWEHTIKFKLKSEQQFSDLLDMFSEIAPHLEILRGPPSEGWGRDVRPWWRQWN